MSKEYAFPSSQLDMRGEPVYGMTLRQYYIGQALAGIMGNPNLPSSCNTHYLAEEVTKVVDAVLLLDGDSK